MEPVVYTPVSAVANLRRSAILGAVIGVAAVVATAIVGHLLLGVLVAVGLGLGALNNRLLQRSVILHATTGTSKKTFRGGVALRLGGITVVALALAFAFRPDGVGLVIGLAVFQLLMLVGAAVPVFRSLRPTT